MALSAFDDKSHQPRDAEVSAVLGLAAPLWRGVLGELRALHPHWGFTSRSTGWGLRLKQGERTILYLTPCRGHFLASAALGGSAVDAAHAAGVPAALRAAVDAAPQHPEGRGVRLDVKDPAGVPLVVALAKLKLGSN